MSFTTLVQRRYDNDKTAIQAAITAADIAAGTKTTLGNALTSAHGATSAAGVSSTGFTTTLPYETAHGDMFGVQAALWRELGHTVMRAWAANPWSYPNAYATPTAIPGTSTVYALRRDVQPTLIRVANPTAATITVTLSVAGMTGSPTPLWATVYKVLWTDTPEMQEAWSRSEPVQTRMEEITASEYGWSMDVAPGFIGEFWIDWDATTEYHATKQASVTDGTTTVQIPISFHVYNVEMPTAKQFSFGTWDRLDTQTRTTADVEALCEGFGYNSPETGGWGIVIGTGVSSQGGTPWTLTMDWTNLRAWVAANPNASRYLIWQHCVGEYNLSGRLGISYTEPDLYGLADENMPPRVGEWARQLHEELDSLGIADKTYLHIYDEPGTETAYTVAVAYMQAIKAGAPNLKLMGNPSPPLAGLETLDADYLAAVDLFMLVYNDFIYKAGQYSMTPLALAQWFQQYGEVGFYDAVGPRHGIDPYYVERMMGIRNYTLGAVGGMNFWLMKAGDFSGQTWVGSNEYTVQTPNYLNTPLFMEATTAFPSKQLAGIRAAQQDYELCKQLETLIAAKPAVTGLATAQTVLDAFAGVDDYSDAYASYMAWQDSTAVKGERTELDAARAAVVEQIAVMTNANPPQSKRRAVVFFASMEF
ncbi:MAG: hypothetical protein ABFD92_21690 [Planctomycetaceae bacterium]